MDFGIARLLDTSVTSTGGIIGTPAYMAPEQAEGREIDARTDIYATGLILYELFTGRPTFDGDTAIAIALKQIRDTPRGAAVARRVDSSGTGRDHPEVPGKGSRADGSSRSRISTPRSRDLSSIFGYRRQLPQCDMAHRRESEHDPACRLGWFFHPTTFAEASVVRLPDTSSLMAEAQTISSPTGSQDTRATLPFPPSGGTFCSPPRLPSSPLR